MILFHAQSPAKLILGACELDAIIIVHWVIEGVMDELLSVG